MKNIITNCPLCEEHSLHLIGKNESQLMQCVWCGYVSSTKFIGTKEKNEEYKKLPKEMKEWSKEAINRIWIPSMITLPFGTIYPIKIDTVMKWACAEMVDIPEENRKNYPVEGQEGKFHTKMYDTISN